MNHHTRLMLALLSVLATSAAACKGKPSCRDSSRYSFTGVFAPAAGPLADATICGVNTSPYDSSVNTFLWGSREDVRPLQLRVRVAMRAQGWQEYDPSNEYVRANPDKLYFQQGQQRLSYEFRATTFRFFGPNERDAINVTVHSSTEQPRRWR